MSARRDDEDAACVDCALSDCASCLEADPAPAGARSCCCGAVDEVDQWADDENEDDD